MCVVTITLLLICFPSNFFTGNITDNGNESYGDSAGNIRCDTTRQRPLGQNENSGVGGRSAGSDCQGATRGGRVKYGGPQGDTAGASGQTSGPGRGDQSADRTQGHSQDPAQQPQNTQRPDYQLRVFYFLARELKVNLKNKTNTMENPLILSLKQQKLHSL